ncbi:MAG: Rrf2 family transcriptional regulator [Bdellovibrionaceae bacterium]|nr:Rrf2 family transcriptional regulator [Pseudobdellovibrionaceae bacterium]
MRLTDHTDYSLRVLMYLNQRAKQTTLNEISAALGISKNNLIQISRRLAHAGFIETSRGRRGGLSLPPSTGALTLKEIILKTEESFEMADCFTEGHKDCSFLRGCLLRRRLNDALKAFLESLGATTLNEVTPGRRFLEISRPAGQ